MKAVGLIFFLLANAYSQLIFPNDNEPIYSFATPAWTRRPFPELNMPSIAPKTDIQPNFVNNIANASPNTVNNIAHAISQPPSRAPVSEDEYWQNHVNNILSQGITKFTVDMVHAINAHQPVSPGSDRNNIVFSPLNLATVLAVVLLGSGGKTFDEIVKILGLHSGIDISGHSEVVHQIFGLLLNSIELKSQVTGVPRSPEVLFASGIFVQEGYPIRSQFSTIARNTYKNDVVTTDFRNHGLDAKNLINNWVNTKTQGKIQNILLEAPDRDTKVILASALYFNGEWYQHFIKTATKRKPFYLASGQTVMVDMMYNGGKFSFYEDRTLGVKILGLPYKTTGANSQQSKLNSAFEFETTMYVLLPTSSTGDSLKELESKLSADVINSLINNIKNETCVIAMPKLKLSSTLSLNRALQSLGLNSLFTPGVANLGLLSSGANASDPDVVIFPRINTDGSSISGTSPKNVINGKKHYFRYEDTVGGYQVQQWNNGVYLEKIRRASRKRRGAMDDTKNKPLKDGRYIDTITDEDKHRGSMIGLGENEYRRIQSSYRNKRQGRPIDNDFVRYIESKNMPTYGLDALRNSANFENPGLYASDVLHKVEIDITETGTVGAAATGIILQRSGDHKRFVANQPFIFFIRHNPTNLILFWGSVNKPTPNYP